MVMWSDGLNSSRFEKFEKYKIWEVQVWDVDFWQTNGESNVTNALRLGTDFKSALMWTIKIITC